MNIQHVQMPAVVNEDGELIPINQAITSSNVKQIPSDQLYEVGYTLKMYNPQMHAVNKELKRRVELGEKFPQYGKVTNERNVLQVDDENFKKEMFSKYGWSALEVKSATQLQKKYGDSVLTDIDNYKKPEEKEFIKWQ